MNRINPAADARKLGLADLKRSGLSPADAKRMKIVFHTVEQTRRLFPYARQPAMVIPYFDLDGRSRKDMFRARFLGVNRGGFGVPAKFPKYLQPAGSPSAPYFPPYCNWRKIANEVTQQIVITEGEKKAVAVCKTGHPAVGLGGVSCVRRRNTSLRLYPELETFAWEGRQVVLVFDTDATPKPEVIAALGRLTKELASRGANVCSLPLPAEPGEKVGVDDFIVKHGKKAFEDLMTEGVDYDELSRRLAEMSGRFVFIESPTGVIDREARDAYGQTISRLGSVRAFRDTFANVRATQRSGEKNREVSVADEFLKWPRRPTAAALVYAPDGVEVPANCFNLYSGLGVDPKAGSIRPWRKLLNRLLDGLAPDARLWFERWLAWPLHPGHTQKRMNCGVCFWGPVHETSGQGKSLLAETMGDIYGRANFAKVTQDVLDSEFNSWLACKQLISVDDVDHYHSRKRHSVLKSLLTSDTVLVNEKNTPRYEVRNHANIIVTSNEFDAVLVEGDNDRRWFVHRVPAGRPNLPVEFYNVEFLNWRRNGGLSALLHHFQNLDFGDFDPLGKPPVTSAKREMVLDTRGELAEWVEEFLSHDLERDIWTAAELTLRYNTDPGLAGRKVDPRRMGHVMVTAGAKAIGQVRDGNARASLLAVRNVKKWIRAGTPALLAEFHKRRVSP